MLRPWADGVESHVGEPVAQGSPALALTLVCEGKIVVRVGILGDQRDGFLIGGSRLSQSLHLIKHVAEVEECERVLGVGDGGFAVMLLGEFVPAQVVVDRSEVDQGWGVLGLYVQDLLIDLRCLRNGGGILFELHRAQEHVLHLGSLPRGSVSGGAHYAELLRGRDVEVKGKLLSQRIHQRAAMPEAQPRAPAHKARLHQWVSHARYALHRIDRSSYAFGGNALVGLKVAQLPQLAESIKRVMFAGGDQPCSLPRRQLARMQVEDPDYVLTAISGHCVSRVAPSSRFDTANSLWSMPSEPAPIKTLSCRVD
jgi:hypothetical protein